MEEFDRDAETVMKVACASANAVTSPRLQARSTTIARERAFALSCAAGDGLSQRVQFAESAPQPDLSHAGEEK